MPMACQDPVFDATAIERKAHVRAAVVEGEQASAVIDHQDRGMATMHHEPALCLKLGDVAHVQKVEIRNIDRHSNRSSACAEYSWPISSRQHPNEKAMARPGVSLAVI